MFLSMACAVHCMAFPLVILIAPLAGFAIFENEMLEYISLVTSIVIASISLFSGYKTHRNIQLVALFIFSILLLVISNLLIPTLYKTWTDALGAFFIATTLFWNLRLTHTHSSSCKH
jgi:hypothetical protein